MDRPPADPVKLLAAWIEWERGETPPGRVMSNLKIAGMRELLESLAQAEGGPSEGGTPAERASEAPTS